MSGHIRITKNYNKSKYEHPRLVIPFYDEQGKVFAYKVVLWKKKQNMLH